MTVNVLKTKILPRHAVINMRTEKLCNFFYIHIVGTVPVSSNGTVPYFYPYSTLS
jgi:hypothetical protein